MINAWSLAYDELYGDGIDKEYPIMIDKNRVTPQESDEYDPPSTRAATATTVLGAAGTDTIRMTGSDDQSWWAEDGFSMTGNPAGSSQDVITFGSNLPGGLGEDHISFTGNNYHAADTIDFSISGLGMTSWDDEKYYARTDGYPGKVSDALRFSHEGPSTINFGDDPYVTAPDVKPEPNFNYKSQKYEEDKGIADLQSYVSSTYSGHYTSKNNNVQTLDLIQSVGDAESFCRSNAIKYLSRYDKKGQAKRDILKAMHYCLLLYYFSGNTQEPDYTNSRYETF
tara:strand:+ start:911 stop:1756 length:846 start_codon:yes stop_codon:yes gene_type:complete